MKKLTIFTPTYNRAHLLPNLYQSILLQTIYNDITWLIIDDCSNDETEDLINKYIKNSTIDIKYFKNKINIGKMHTFNKAIELAESEWFVCVDSDDILLPSFSDFFKILDINENVAGYVSKMKIKDYNQNLPHLKYVKFLDLYDEYHYKYDLLLTFKTKVLKNYKFPKFGDEKFISERVFFTLINGDWEFIIYNEFTISCFYQPNGYSANSADIVKSNPVGWAAYYYSLTKTNKNFAESIKYILISSSLFWLGSTKAREDFLKFYSFTVTEKILLYIGWPISLIRRIKYNLIKSKS